MVVDDCGSKVAMRRFFCSVFALSSFISPDDGSDGLCTSLRKNPNYRLADSMHV